MTFCLGEEVPSYGIRLSPGQHSDRGFVGFMNQDGGLTAPAEEMKKIFTDFEKYFVRYHGVELDREYDPIGKVTTILHKVFPHINRFLIDFYSRTRFHIRRRFLNDNLKVMERVFKKRYVNHVNKF